MQEVSRTQPTDIESYVSAVDGEAELLRGRLGDQIPDVGLIIGKGATFSMDLVRKEATVFSGKKIPSIDLASLEGIPMLVAEGAYYRAESHSMQDVTLPVRVMGVLGVKVLVVINAAYRLEEGDDVSVDLGASGDSKNAEGICLIADHINYFSNSPLVGHNVDEWGPRFPDMTEPYDIELRKRCLSIAGEMGWTLKERVLLALSESSRASVDATNRHYLKTLGADILGFDMVPEVITARHMDMRVVGLSCLLDAPPDAEAGSDFVYDKEQMRSSVLTLLKAIASFI